MFTDTGRQQIETVFVDYKVASQLMALADYLVPKKIRTELMIRSKSSDSTPAAEA